jgi:hydrogenase nickel incorporation protein HypA/HybF
MHELSIANSIVETLTRELAGEPGRVRAVRVDVGVLSGVVPDALRFAWDLACEGTRLDGAGLEIREIPLMVHCESCEADRTLPGIDRLRCPVCGEATPVIVAGKELNLREVEMTGGAAG